MEQPLVIVLRTEPARYAYLQRLFNETMDVILDRRSGVRRRREAPPAAERRRQDRRRHDVTEDLRTSGWALVKR